jgi:hypothetical protein
MPATAAFYAWCASADGFSQYAFGPGFINWNGGDFPDDNTLIANVTANSLRGSNLVTVSTTTGLSVGQVRAPARSMLQVLPACNACWALARGGCPGPAAGAGKLLSPCRCCWLLQTVRIVMDNINGDLLADLNNRLAVPFAAYTNRTDVIRWTSVVTEVGCIRCPADDDDRGIGALLSCEQACRPAKRVAAS